MNGHLHSPKVEEQARAFYRGSVVICDLAQEQVVQLLDKILRKSDHDLAVIGTYHRIHMWMRTVAKLDHPIDFQTALVAARGMFELFVDLKLLIADPSLTAKYHDFTFVTRYAAAKKYIEYLDADATYVRPVQPEMRRTFVTDSANAMKFDVLRLKHWGRDKRGNFRTPDHWMGDNFPERCAKTDPPEVRRYRDTYSQESWFVHAGSAGIAGVSADGVLAGFACGHARCQDLFAEATALVCENQHLFEALPDLRDKFDLARVAAGMFAP